MSEPDPTLCAPLGAEWRARAARAQEEVVPRGAVTISCSAPFGVGGLGRHLQEITEALERLGRRPTVLSGSERAEPSLAARSPRHPLGIPYLFDALSAMPLPSTPGINARAFMAEFDAHAAERLAPAEHLIAFNGQASRQFRAARRAGYQSLSLVSANSHLRRVQRQHARARRQYPLERSWAAHLLRRNIAEYARADRIYVASRYTRESFLEEGVEEEKLALFPFTPDPRYRPQSASRKDTFDIVYIGSLSVVKGVPLLVDAVRRLAHDDIRLILVGGWATRGMRRFLERARSEDARISVRPGDPLAHLRGARLCVHPTYEDGFGYAPAEALACGIPVIVSADTGMKDLIEPGRSGAIVPTGDLAALSDAIEAAYRGELLGA
jgi:glycosyltransferase involved in cell wall biosynthesis